MSIFDVLANPGALIGCLVGIGVAALLHWLLPTQDLVVIQALLIVACTIVGLILESKNSEDKK